MEKTYKIGEYAVGGIVTIAYNPTSTGEWYRIEFKDWNTKKIIVGTNVPTRQQALDFLEENTTSYYADIIINFKPFKNKK